MTDSTFARAAELFLKARALSGDARGAFLDAECAGSRDLRERVEKLLEAQRAALPFGSLAADLSELRAHLSPQATPAPSGVPEPDPARIGPYTILGRLGEGGFGVVYLAEQSEPVQRKVALKVIKLGMDTRQVVARFDGERHALGLMDHPAIARVLDAGATPTGRPYFVMELVHGAPITAFCDEHRLAPRERLALVRLVCEAVQHAHAKGIIHRDIKPSNILASMLDGRPIVKIIDFGIAKAVARPLSGQTAFTELRQLVGTPEYMSPEQADPTSSDIDTRSDVYSLGVLLYELLTGRTPLDSRELRSKAFDEMRRLIREQDPPKPSTKISTLGETLTQIAERRSTHPAGLSRLIRGELDWIVMRCLERDRARRYQTAAALADDLGRYLSGLAVEAGPPSASYRFRKFAARNRGILAGAGVVAATGTIAIASLAYAVVAVQHERDGAQDALKEAKNARAAEHTQREAAVASQNEAERQADIASAVNRFFNDHLLQLAHPLSLGRDVKLVDALAVASAKVDTFTRTPPEVLAALYNSTGRLNHALGNRAEGERLMGRAVELARGAVSEGARRDLATYRYDYARGLTEMGRQTDAEREVREALAIWDRSSDARSRRSLVSGWAFLARVLLAADRIEDADQAADRGVALANIPPENEMEEDRSERLVAQATKATALWRRGEREAALELQERVTREICATRPETDRERLNMETTLAMMKMDMGNHEGAESVFRRSLGDHIERRGERHPSVIGALRGLGVILFRDRKHAEAIPYLRRAVELARGTPESDPRDLVSALLTLGASLRQIRETEEAAQVLSEAVERAERLGMDRTDLGEALVSLANVSMDLKHHEEAEPLLRRAIPILKARLGEPHPSTVRASNTFCMILVARAVEKRELDAAREADAMLPPGVQSLERTHGKTHGLTLFIRDHQSVASAACAAFDGQMARDERANRFAKADMDLNATWEERIKPGGVNVVPRLETARRLLWVNTEWEAFEVGHAGVGTRASHVARWAEEIRVLEAMTAPEKPVAPRDDAP